MSHRRSTLPRRFSTIDDYRAEPLEASTSKLARRHSAGLLDDEDFHANEFEMRRNDEDGLDITYNNDPWNGVFGYLTAQCHDNPVKAGLIHVSGNSFNPSYVDVLPHIVQKDWTGMWCSANEPNSYVMFDFLDHKLKLTHYTLKTYNQDQQWRHLKSWVVEGGNNGAWKELHRVKRGNHLNGAFKVASFAVDKASYYQCIRFRMIGPNHYGDYHLFLMGVELFGILD